VAANLRWRGPGEPAWWPASSVVIERAGVRVAFVGIVGLDTPQITHSDATDLLEFVEPAESVRAALEALEGRCDLVVPLTHQGVDDDRELARAVPELELIVGGHSHTYLSEGAREGDTLIVQAGDKATVLGRADVWLHPDTGEVLASEARLIHLFDEPEVPVVEVETLCADVVAASEAEMNVVVGRLAGPLPRKVSSGTSPAGNLVADVMRAHSGADVAIQNRGGLRTDLAEGDVTRRCMFELLPFANDLVVLTLTGEELRETVRRCVEGEANSVLEFSGMHVVVEPATGEDGYRLVEVRVGELPLDPWGQYMVATNSFLAAGGDGFFALEREVEQAPSGVVLRELLEEHVRKVGTVEPDASNRFTVLAQEPATR
jgi:5'-nucleotidase